MDTIYESQEIIPINNFFQYKPLFIIPKKCSEFNIVSILCIFVEYFVTFDYSNSVFKSIQLKALYTYAIYKGNCVRRVKNIIFSQTSLETTKPFYI